MLALDGMSFLSAVFLLVAYTVFQVDQRKRCHCCALRIPVSCRDRELVSLVLFNYRFGREHIAIHGLVQPIRISGNFTKPNRSSVKTHQFLSNRDGEYCSSCHLRFQLWPLSPRYRTFILQETCFHSSVCPTTTFGLFEPKTLTVTFSACLSIAVVLYYRSYILRDSRP